MKKSTIEAKYKIEVYEYKNNAMNLLNNSGVDVRNVKFHKDSVTADVILYFEDIKERHDNCEYPLSLFA